MSQTSVFTATPAPPTPPCHAQVRWEPIKGFHVPDLACHECSTLQDTLKVCSLGGSAEVWAQ